VWARLGESQAQRHPLWGTRRDGLGVLGEAGGGGGKLRVPARAKGAGEQARYGDKSGKAIMVIRVARLLW